MGIIFQRTLKCGNCGYEYHGKCGGHIIANGEHYDISQYYCKTCHSIVDLECYSSLKENKEKYFYPDGTEEVCDIVEKREEEPNLENALNNITVTQKELPPLCQKCAKHMFKLDIDSGEYVYCPKCGHKSLKQKEIHVVVCVD